MVDIFLASRSSFTTQRSASATKNSFAVTKSMPGCFSIFRRMQSSSAIPAASSPKQTRAWRLCLAIRAANWLVNPLKSWFLTGFALCIRDIVRNFRRIRIYGQWELVWNYTDDERTEANFRPTSFWDQETAGATKLCL